MDCDGLQWIAMVAMVVIACNEPPSNGAEIPERPRPFPSGYGGETTDVLSSKRGTMKAGEAIPGWKAPSRMLSPSI
jgi:hypothetical protein